MRLLFSKSIRDNFKQFLEDSEYFYLFLFLFFHLKLDSSWLHNYLSHSKIGLRCLEKVNDILPNGGLIVIYHATYGEKSWFSTDHNFPKKVTLHRQDV